MSIKCQYKGGTSLKWLGNIKVETHYMKEDCSLSGRMC